MGDAATGGRSVFARAIEKVNLGVPKGELAFLNLDSVDISRLDDENASLAITGNDGADRGTPGDIKFQDKFKYSMTASRVLFDLVAMFGKPKSVEVVAFKIAEISGGLAGTLYAVGDPLVFDYSGGSGAGASGYVSAVDDPVTGVITEVKLVDGGYGFAPGDPAPSFTITSAHGTGAGAGTSTLGDGEWLVKIRPSRLNDLRSATLYLFEGGSYTPQVQMGRRAALISIAGGANKRAEIDVTYADPTGDTISGFSVAKDGNTGTFTGKLSSRGRRPYDANYTDKKSLYLKVTAVDGAGVTFVSAYDAASVLQDGTDFPTPSYGSDAFVAPWPSDSFDGYTIALDAAGKSIGLFGENFEAFEISPEGRGIGSVTVTTAGTDYQADDQIRALGAGNGFKAHVATVTGGPPGPIATVTVDDPGHGYGAEATLYVLDSVAGVDAVLTPVPSTTDFANDDEFEIPSTVQELEKSTVPESRFSTFHLIRKLGGSLDVRIDKGTTKLERPYKAYRANGRRIPQAIDPMGDVKAVWSFSKRLFDRYFRETSDQHSRFSVYDRYAIENTSESVEIFAAQTAVKGLKSGDIASKNVLEETVTLESEQPETVGVVPTGFDGTYPLEVNVRTRIDPVGVAD